MNGADVLLRTLVDNGVTTCFANPGTSEMQFVAALDRTPGMRAVLCLFEGVATGAADGYARMTGRPAATLLHLGPGYSNGAANLHNAKRAGTPVVNVVGDHATYHKRYDAPLNSDIEALAGPTSKWVRSAQTADEIAALTAEAVTASLTAPRAPVSLILPADTAWTETEDLALAQPAPELRVLGDEVVAAVADQIRRADAPYVLMAGSACGERGLAAASRLAAMGIRVLTESFVARQRRGRDVFAPEKLAYFAEIAQAELAAADLLVLVEATSPVAFFAYPGRPSELTPLGCRTARLAERGEAGDLALERLADMLGAPGSGVAPPTPSAKPPAGDLNAHSAGGVSARHLPAGAIVSDDAVTASQPIFQQTAAAAPHDWLMLTGGAIGQGLPVALGAAVACPGRKVVSINGDGAAMYTNQALWTLARERLDVTVVVFANGAYRILGVEFGRTGSGERPGSVAERLLDLGDPDLDWVSLARGMGVLAVRCDTTEQFDAAFAAAMAERGPRLIEVVTGGRAHRASATAAT